MQIPCNIPFLGPPYILHAPFYRGRPCRYSAIPPSWGPHIYCMHHFRGRQCRYPAISPSWGPHIYCMHHFIGGDHADTLQYPLPGAPIYTACTIIGGDHAAIPPSWGPHTVHDVHVFCSQVWTLIFLRSHWTICFLHLLVEKVAQPYLRMEDSSAFQTTTFSREISHSTSPCLILIYSSTTWERVLQLFSYERMMKVFSY